jgi:hypothetical protein
MLSPTPSGRVPVCTPWLRTYYKTIAFLNFLRFLHEIRYQKSKVECQELFKRSYVIVSAMFFATVQDQTDPSPDEISTLVKTLKA